MSTSSPSPAPQVVVLHATFSPDAPPDELDSQNEVEAIVDALRGLDFSVERLPVTVDLRALIDNLARLQPQLVFNLVDTLESTSQLISIMPLLLEHLRLPFTGCGSLAMGQTTDKLATKQMLTAAGLPTPSWIALGAGADAGRSDYPYIVKSVMEDASLGIFSDSVVHDAAALRRILAARQQRFGGRWFAERYIDGREINVSLIQRGSHPEVLGVSEIHFEEFPPELPRILDYDAKWAPDSFVCTHTYSKFSFAAEDEPLLGKVRQIALECWPLFHLSGYARVDFRVDAQGNPFVLEVNVNPCLSPNAGFVRTAAQAGISYSEMVRQIVAAAGAAS